MFNLFRKTTAAHGPKKDAHTKRKNKCCALCVCECNTVKEKSKPKPKPKNANRAGGISDSRAERPTLLSVPALPFRAFPVRHLQLTVASSWVFSWGFPWVPRFFGAGKAGSKKKKESQLQPLLPFLLALRQFKTAKVLNVRLAPFYFQVFPLRGAFSLRQNVKLWPKFACKMASQVGVAGAEVVG